MTVLIAVPFYGCAEYIAQTVTSVLAQTHTDLVCLVAGDGEPVPLTMSDERLVTVTFPTNEGAPATQQAMLAASPYEWYAAVGADDWLDPGYLERLLALPGRAKASAALWHEYPDHSLLWRDHAHAEFGVFEANLLRSVGGYGIDKRCGQDTLLYVDILPHSVTFSWSDAPAYHKRMRPDSLTHAPETTFGSPYRESIFAHNAEVRRACERIGWADREAVRAYRERLATPEQRETLAARVELVRDALTQAVPA